MFCSVFPSGSDETINRLKRSSGVILAIFSHFCKTEKARIGAISWADIGSVWTPLSILKKLARWPPVQKVIRDFTLSRGNLAIVTNSKIPETDPVKHVRRRIGISAWGKTFSDKTVDLNFLQRAMNWNQFTAAIIRITLKSFVRQIKILWAQLKICPSPYSRF